jgi:energy-converting hydrogenase Eha subunit E
MSIVFYLIGCFMIAGGAAWTVLAVIGGSAARTADTSDVVATVLLYGAAVPGIGVIVSGLLFLAVGRALALLARIARNTRQSHPH